MRGVVLDMDTLHPQDLSLHGLLSCLDDWQCHHASAAEQVIERLAGASVVVTNKVPISAEVMAAVPTLKLICVAATGTNNIDLAAAQRCAIEVANVRDYAAPSVAQHVFALLLGLATRWHEYHADVRAGVWSQAPMFCLMQRPVLELAGKTLGIIGYGVLGREVARLAQAFGMRVLIAQSLRAGSSAAQQQERVPLAQLLSQSDVVSLHCPLTAETEQLVNAAFLAGMKPGAWLINTARGALLDESALKQALLSGQLGAAALDVLSEEPPRPDHPLLAANIPNLLITPHNAWISRECRQRLLDGVVANIRAWRQRQA